MARNVQVKRYALFCPILLLTASCIFGCGKKSELTGKYSFEERVSSFSSTGESNFFPAFAADVAVPALSDSTGEELSVKVAGVLSLDGGTALYQKHLLDRVNPASTTKVMTSIVALKYGTLTDMVKIPSESVINEAGSSMAGVKPGDVMSLKDLLYGLLIPSGNDAANAIAVHVGGSIDQFVELMNEEAARIGATQTHFANANGLTDPDHYTTAYDLYLMFHEALKYDLFREIIGAHSYTASYRGADGEEKTAVWSVGNYYMNGKAEAPEGLTVFGGKTGTTKAAGYCLIMGNRDNTGREYASVIMGAENRDGLYKNMTKIIENIVK